jgi:hypothetical protein
LYHNRIKKISITLLFFFLAGLCEIGSSCEEKMQSLGEFLAEFVGDEDGEAYAEYLESQSEPQSSEEQALTVSP